MAFNPFNRPIGDSLDQSDLQTLVADKVAEGYQVEYKSQFPSNDKIGHSIASFANTYGGWYIVGVNANKTDNTPICIPGFSLDDIPDPIARVRDVAKSHIDPIPVFHPQVVSLTGKVAVLVVYVPAEQETPFVSKDGRIYRRHSDSSDPVSETDRYALDRLIENGGDVRGRFETFCKDRRLFSKAESNRGWVNIFLSPYPLGAIEKEDLSLTDNLCKLLESSNRPHSVPLGPGSYITGNMPFDSARTSHRSVVLEQRGSESLHNNTVGIQLFADGRAKLFVPLQSVNDFDYIDSQDVKSFLREVVGVNPKGLLQFFDMGALWLSIANLVTFYEHWLERPEWMTQVQVAITLQNVWRAVAFFDSDEWVQHVQQLSLPIVRENSVTVPEPIGRGSSVDLGGEIPLWLRIGVTISEALGLPWEPSSSVLAEALDRAVRKTQTVGAVRLSPPRCS